MPRPRLFDVATADKMADLHEYAREHRLALTTNFDAMAPDAEQWLVLLFDARDVCVATGRGKFLSTAIKAVHDRLIASAARET